MLVRQCRCCRLSSIEAELEVASASILDNRQQQHCLANNMMYHSIENKHWSHQRRRHPTQKRTAEARLTASWTMDPVRWA